MSHDEPLTSSTRRFLRLGGLVGRVGASIVGDKILDLGRSEARRHSAREESLLRQATRIVSTLGEMKGAAMKVGQMLSLQEGLLPPEIAEVLRSLQKEAPSVPFEVMRWEVEGGLGRALGEVFRSLEEVPLASASIGQVHRGTLVDGRPVAVKIQYPLIDQIVAADLDNLELILGRLFGLVSGADFAPVWREVRDRLLEEIDYRHEASSLRRMRELHADVPEIVVPAVVEEASAQNVLTMELVEGMSPDEACAEQVDPSLRDRWGRVLFEFAVRGLLEDRFLHADPNLANYAFREDGSVVVYDCGCVKRVPAPLAAGYARLFIAAAEGRREEIPAILFEIDVHQDGGPLPPELIGPYHDLLGPILREDPPYTFDEDPEIYRKLFDLGLQNLSSARGIRFPEDVVFIDRALSGHFGNLRRLQATGPWREILLRYSRSCLSAES